MADSKETGRIVEDVARGILSLAQGIRDVSFDDEKLRGLLSVAEKVNLVMESMELWEWVEKTYSQSGFLPYRAVPFVEFYRECEGNYDLFYSRVSKYYEDNQQEILQNIESELTTLAIDEEPKATLQEAIQGHRHRLFRLSCRGLLPDIERVIFQEWLGREGIGSVTEKSIEKAIEQKHLEDFTPNNLLDLVLFKRLISHLYRNGKHFKDIRNESMPNRPAALHGWLSYSSEANSLNTIIFADYIFRLSILFKEAQD